MITYFVQSPGLYVAFGLSTDTKPPTPPDDCLFIETDTALIFFSLATVWTLVTTGTNFVLTDVTTNNVNTSRHGFAPKSSGVATEFLNGLGGYSVPAGGGGGSAYTDFTKDLGVSRRSGTFDITGLSGLTVDKVVSIVQTAVPIASKGNARDEPEMDLIRATGYVVNATTIRAYWQAQGVMVGSYNFAFQVSG